MLESELPLGGFGTEALFWCKFLMRVAHDRSEDGMDQDNCVVIRFDVRGVV